MSVLRHSATTRHNLMRLRKRLERVETAAALLNRKRRALVNELFRAARPVLEAREAIDWQAMVAWAALLQAESDRGQPLLRALATPLRELRVELRETEALGLPRAEIVGHDPVRRHPADRGVAVGPSGPAAAAAAAEFEALAELLLDTASRELLIRRLARALEQTSRRVNLLERRIAPRLEVEMTRIDSALEEREREEQLRYRRLLTRPRESGRASAES